MSDEKVVCIPGETKKLDSSDDVAYIVKQIEECEGLTTLQLSGNSFGVEAAKAIGEALANKPHFSTALWSDVFVSRLKTEIPQSLIALGEGILAAEANLVELDLSDNAFGPTGVEPIIPLLTSSSFYSIKVLKFNNNGLGIKGGTILSKALLQCHEEARSVGEKLALEVFVAGRNRLENEGAKALSEVFEAIGSLVQVSMPQNGIDYDGVCALASAFKNNPNLEVIDLNDNTFTEVGSKSMAEVLPSLPKLRVINFGDCLVRSDGAYAIADAIKDGHQQLEEINLSYCELDQDAGLAVAAAMANKKALKEIELNGNIFGAGGIELLRGSLEAKGHIDALGTLSDDEGSEDEDGEKEEEEDESTTANETNQSEDIEEDSTAETTRLITLEEYLRNPNGDTLVALGEERIQLLLDHLAHAGSEEEPLIEEKLSRTVAMFMKVTSDYCNHLADVHETVESVIDAILQPSFEDGLGLQVTNEILIQIGLLKSEDKSFLPVKEIDGPIQALMHIARSSYFTRLCADVLIAFFTKPCSALKSLQSQDTVCKLLQTLHAV